MEKTGRQRVSVERTDKKPRKCVNCGGRGEYKVTFEDSWGKLIVTLCEDCSMRRYEDLELQTRFDWDKMVYP